jgi:spore maturation protein CgeB
MADISYIGTNLPDKRNFFKKNVIPLAQEYQLRLYGQDWNTASRMLGWGQRVGQYFNIPGLRSVRKPSLGIGDEGAIYKSSAISINIHEQYQREFGGDCNERTFKIPFFGGFEVTDNVACIQRYFKKGSEMIVGENDRDWVEKIHFYLKNPDERLEIINAGKARVLAEHTYIHRAQKMIDISLGNQSY